ncbi:MAG: DNA translocase FtsK 4TM domain-containing protein, partial [Bacteroidota bacterium]|nr:DNA translocase FtsK 4TM domain-containing protein [Bacteroidota bacterium]
MKKIKYILERFSSLFKIEDERIKKVFGFLFLFSSLYLIIVFISFLINGHIDQDKLGQFTDEISNFGGVFGHRVSNLFLYQWFGLSSFIFPVIMFNWGLFLVFKNKLFSVFKSFNIGLVLITWISLFFGFFTPPSVLGGVFGSEMNAFLDLNIGKVGTGFFLFLSLLVFVIIKFNPRFSSRKSEKNDLSEALLSENEEKQEVGLETEFSITETEPSIEHITEDITTGGKTDATILENKDHEISIEVHVNEEDTISSKDIKTNLEDLGDYDPTLDLSNYKIPKVNLLNDYGSGKIEIDKSELEANKNRIVETLANYKISIESISATIGPTITLYEIVPEAGIRISKIKNLEDDIALSLSALGIRIIAPIPGKGTIGIEVPNQNPATVS